MNEEEIWEDIPDFPGYQVSNLGNVRSWWLMRQHKLGNKPRLLKLQIQNKSDNYAVAYIGLWRDGKQPRRLVHRLVLEAFVGPCPKGCEACHNDGDSLNNGLENLRWDTMGMNKADAVRHGSYRGIRNPKSKLTPVQVREIRSLATRGVSRYDLAETFNMSHSEISRVITHQNWRHVT